MNTLEEFVEKILNENETIQSIVSGRVYSFKTQQGTHTYPMIFWEVITDATLSDYLSGVGQARKAEVQVSVFTKSVSASAQLAKIVSDVFNAASVEGNILSCYSNEIVPTYCDEDETIQYSVRIFINHKL